MKSLLLVSAVLASAAIATPVLALPTVSVVGAGTIGLAPSADSLTLSNGSNVATTGIFDFQPGIFDVENSGPLVTMITGSVTEAVTIGASTGFVTLNYLDDVTLALDTLSITSTPVTIGGYTLTVLPFLLPDGAIGAAPFTLQATLTAVPEPAAFALFGIGALALGFARRK